MKKLTDQQLAVLANRILANDPYKEEFNNPYYRGVARRMIVDAMKLALEAADDSKPSA